MLPVEIWVIILSLVPEMLDVIKMVNHQMQDIAKYLQKGTTTQIEKKGGLIICHLSTISDKKYYRRQCSYNTAKNGHISLVQWIVEKSRMEPCKKVPLTNIFKGVVEGGQIEILEWLLDHSYLVWIRDGYCVEAVVKDLKTLEWIHENIYSRYSMPNDIFLRALTKFASEGDIEAIERTLGYFPSKNTDKIQKALWNGILESGNLTVFEFCSGEYEGFGDYQINEIIKRNHVEIFGIMFKKLPSSINTLQHILTMATNFGSLFVIEWLFEKGYLDKLDREKVIEILLSSKKEEIVRWIDDKYVD